MPEKSSDALPSPPGYASLVRLPGVKAPFIFATFGRFSFGPLPLALLLAVESATGSYSDAGVALAAFGFGALNAPIKARILDSYGNRIALPIIGVAYATSIALLAVACTGSAPPSTLIMAAGIAGFCSPPLGPVMRALWSHLTDSATRRRAYSLDSALEQTIFAVGPAIGAGVIAVSSAPLLLAVLGLLACIGSIGLAAQPISARPFRPESNEASVQVQRKRLVTPGFVATLGSILGIGTALGILDVAIAARADEQGASAAAGILFTALAAGSVAGGLIWGRLRPAARRSTELAALTVALSLMTALLVFVGNLMLVAIVLALGGLAVAPAYVVANTTADDLASGERKTEAMTWVNTSNNIGAVVGAAIAGALLEIQSLESTFVAATIILVCTATALSAASIRIDGAPRD